MTAQPDAPKTATPKYRHYVVPPAAVRLTVDDLTTLLPEGAWIGSEADKKRELALPTAEILETNYPRIRFSRLCDLLPGCVRYMSEAPEWIALPTDRVVLAYKPETRRELIEEPAPEKPEPKAQEKPAIETPAEPATDSEKKPEGTEAAKEAPKASGWRRLLKPILAGAPAQPREEKPASEESKENAPVEAEKKAETPVAEKIEKADAPPPAPAAPAPEKASVPIPLTRLPAELESKLQEVFMVEDALTVQRLVDLSSELPGIQGCVLSRGTVSVSSPGVPPGLDIRALSSGAVDLLQKMGASSGLKLTPALTLYSDAGPLSFLQHGDLHLLVVHRQRGFLPGVREKLETVLHTISGALPAPEKKP